MDEKKNDTAETPAFKTSENAPVRRVGTLTLGVCLIVCGVLFLCYFFVPHFNWELALKIAPAAGLILLGCASPESDTAHQKPLFHFSMHPHSSIPFLHAADPQSAQRHQ